MDLTNYEKQQLRAMLKDRDSDPYQRGYRAGVEAALAIAHDMECGLVNVHIGVCFALREHLGNEVNDDE